jgi:hypothetical protein
LLIVASTVARSQHLSVCGHLVGGAARTPFGFYQSAIEPEYREWGDLNGWCNACEQVRAQQDEWNDISENFASIQLVCAGCFVLMKAMHGEGGKLFRD